MPNNTIKMNKLHQVLRLGGSTHGTRSIAVMLGLSHTTVRKYPRICHRLGLSLAELLSKDDAIADKIVANALMDRIAHQAVRIELESEEE